MESFVANLKQEASCSLCSERFLEPKLLKCFHTFCKVCIKRHAELVDEGNIFKCPKCTSEISLPQLNNVEDLKPSVLHQRILKVLAVVESEKVCSFSESHSPASWYCFDCTCSLCDDCQSCHLRFTRDHNLVSLSNLKKEDIESMLARENNCEYHNGCKLDFFCQECDRFICVECLKYDHINHSMTLNENHASTVRATLDTQLKQLAIQEQKMSSHVKVLENIAMKTRDKGQIAIKEVKEKAKAIIEKVQERERELIQQIEQQIEQNNKRKKRGQCELDQTKSSQSYITQMIDKGLPASEMTVISNICINRINGTVIGLDDSQLVFVESQEYTRLINAGFGTLVSKLENLEQKKEESFDLILRPCDHEDDLMRNSDYPAQADKVTSKCIEDHDSERHPENYNTEIKQESRNYPTDEEYDHSNKDRKGTKFSYSEDGQTALALKNFLFWEGEESQEGPAAEGRDVRVSKKERKRERKKKIKRKQSETW